MPPRRRHRRRGARDAERCRRSTNDAHHEASSVGRWSSCAHDRFGRTPTPVRSGLDRNNAFGRAFGRLARQRVRSARRSTISGHRRSYVSESPYRVPRSVLSGRVTHSAASSSARSRRPPQTGAGTGCTTVLVTGFLRRPSPASRSRRSRGCPSRNEERCSRISAADGSNACR